jgi:hypothetical protein
VKAGAETFSYTEISKFHRRGPTPGNAVDVATDPLVDRPEIQQTRLPILPSRSFSRKEITRFGKVSRAGFALQLDRLAVRCTSVGFGPSLFACKQRGRVRQALRHHQPF